MPLTRRYVQAFSTDNPYLPQDYLVSLKNDPDKVRRQRLWEGNWEYAEDNDALVTYDALSDAFTNTVVKNGQKYLVVDVARLGRDATTFTYWDDLENYRIEQYQKQATNVTVQKVRDVAAMERIPFSHILVDEDGVGGGVVDHLPGVKGFTANSTPVATASQVRERLLKVDSPLIPKTTFGNLKAQCAWKLAELVNERRVAFRASEYRDAILEDLTALLRDREPDGDGKKRLRPKDEVKQEIGRSPDIGDAFIMRAYFELVNDSQGTMAEAMVKAKREQEVVFSRNARRRGMNESK